jgi:trigger factor
MEEQSQRLTAQGMALDTYLGSIGSSQDRFHDEAMEEAERQVRNTLLLEAFAEQREITIGEEDVDAELDRLMERFPGQDRQAMREYYLANDGRERMKSSLRERKAIDALMEELLTSAEEAEVESESTESEPEIEKEDG